MSKAEREALEAELIELEYSAAPWTQEDLDRQAAIYRLLSEKE